MFRRQGCLVCSSVIAMNTTHLLKTDPLHFQVLPCFFAIHPPLPATVHLYPPVAHATLLPLPLLVLPPSSRPTLCPGRVILFMEYQQKPARRLIYIHWCFFLAWWAGAPRGSFTLAGIVLLQASRHSLFVTLFSTRDPKCFCSNVFFIWPKVEK